MQPRKVPATMLILLLALAIVSPLISIIPVSAGVEGTLTILEPDVVAPGGPIWLDGTGLTRIDGGTVYFYLSTNDDPEVSSGDVYFDSIKKSDWEDAFWLCTVWVPSTIKNETYYVKAADLKRIGATPVAVSTETVEVPEEYPTVTIDPTEGNVDDEPTFEGEGADDYDGGDVTIGWEEYGSALYWVTSAGVIADGEFEVDGLIPHDFEGTHKIVVMLTDTAGDTLGTGVEFKIEPAMAFLPGDLPQEFSIEAEQVLDQTFTVRGTGFPEGTVDADTILLVIKDFKTGTTIDTYDTTHLEVDVSDVLGSEGDLLVDCTLSYVEAGVADLRITVDGKTRIFEDVFYASEPTAVADFTTIKYSKVSEAAGYIEDEVDIEFINLPANADITIEWVGETVTKTAAIGMADGFGAWKGTYVVGDLNGDGIVDLTEGIPGGAYSVRASVTADTTTREKNIATFEVLSQFEVWKPLDDEVLEEAEVGDDVDGTGDELRLRGTGFPADALIKKVYFAGEEVDCEDYTVLDTGLFLIEDDEDGNDLDVPHISGGGKSITVRIEGEDAEGEALAAETTLIVNPRVLVADEGDWEVGVLETDGSWDDFDAAPVIFPGNPVKIVGFGFLADESVTAKLYDADDDLIGTCTITSGGRADDDGDLELVCKIPVLKALYPGGEDDVYIKVAGSTATNKDNIENLDIAASDDDLAKIFFGLEDDGDLDLEVNVGDKVKVVGCGFRTKSLTLKIQDTGVDEEVKTLSQSYGHFETTIEIPELESSWEATVLNKWTLYRVVETETEPDTLSEQFELVPKIELVPTSGPAGGTFTVKGTAFEDGVDVDIYWVGITEDKLDTVDGADVEDGSFEIDVEAPATVAAAYEVEARVTGVPAEEYPSATFTVLDPWRAEIVSTLEDLDKAISDLGDDVGDLSTSLSGLRSTVEDLSTAVEAIDPEAIATAISGLEDDVAALESAVNAVKTDVAGAASAAADAASAASNAASAASDAKSAAEAAQSTAAGISTAVYGAMALSLIAAIAAIAAVLTLRAKVAA